MSRARPIPKCELRPVWLQRPERAEVNLDLWLPPSVNALYRNVPGVGRVKSKSYKDWQATAGKVAQAQRLGRIVGLADVEIQFPVFRGDADNRVKACLDAAVSLGILADDGPRYVRNITIHRGDATNGMVRLTFSRVSNAASSLPEAA